MYGGIFTDRPFEFNLKCIVISLFLGLAYWFTPTKNSIVLVMILIMSYLAISWYDHVYGCSPRMKSGQYTPRSIFKAQERDPEEMALVPPPEYTYLRLVYAFHLIVVAPLVLYCGIKGYEWTPKEDTFSKYMFSTLISVGVLAAMYHSFRLVYPRQITPTIPISTYTGAPTPGIITLGRTQYINARGIPS
jgi:hypothetical protein